MFQSLVHHVAAHLLVFLELSFRMNQSQASLQNPVCNMNDEAGRGFPGKGVAAGKADDH